MAGTCLKTYKVGKGSTLKAIANKFGIRRWETIWELPDNRRLASKRGVPENLQPGDVLIIPPSDQERKTQQKEAASNAAAQSVAAKRLAEQIEKLERVIKSYNRIIDDNEKTTQKLVKELEGAQKGMRSMGDRVDLANMFINLGKTLASFAQLGLKASKAAGEELEEINEQALEKLCEHLNEQTRDQILKILASFKNSRSKAILAIAAAADAYDKMTSPSFWAYVYTLTIGDKPLLSWKTWGDIPSEWREAVTTKIGGNIDNRIRQVEQSSDSTIKELRRRKRELIQQLVALKKAASQATDGAKQANKEAAALRLP